MAILTCYNKACSTKGKFEESENGEEACRFHPGGPVFHDALKVRLSKVPVTDLGVILSMLLAAANQRREFMKILVCD